MYRNSINRMWGITIPYIDVTSKYLYFEIFHVSMTTHFLRIDGFLIHVTYLHFTFPRLNLHLILC